MSIVMKRMTVRELYVKGEPIGVFREDDTWNGLLKYTAITGMYKGEHLIVIGGVDRSTSTVFFDLWDDIFESKDAETDITPIMGSPTLIANIKDMLKEPEVEPDDRAT